MVDSEQLKAVVVLYGILFVAIVALLNYLPSGKVGMGFLIPEKVDGFDGIPAVLPTASPACSKEICDSVDNDCDLLADEDGVCAVTEGGLRHDESERVSGFIIEFKDAPLVVKSRELDGQVGISSGAKAETLVRYKSGLVASHSEAIGDFGIVLGIADIRERVTSSYSVAFNGVAIRLKQEEAESLRSDSRVKNVFSDFAVYSSLMDTIPLVNADDMWLLDASGNLCETSGNPCLTGEGVKVAVIDTGIDYTRPDLGGCLGAGCKVEGGYDFINNDADPLDDNGHGTHVAGIIAADGTLKGVAPGAKLYSYKALGHTGSGTWSAVLSSIEAAIDPNNDGNLSDHLDLISMSIISYDDPTKPQGGISAAIANAVDVGIPVIISNGNSGPLGSTLCRQFLLDITGDSYSVCFPATEKKAISVGSSTKSDAISGTSSRGPTRYENVKPDIIAPGVGVCSSRYGAYGTPCFDDTHALASGTSMAAPHVSGIVALLKQAHPGWTPYQFKYALRNSAQSVNLHLFLQGWGRVDALESFHKDISAMVELMDVPVNADGYVSGPMDVQSSITGQDFANYVLEYMQSSQYPTGSWAFLSSSNSIPGDGIVLNDYDTRLLPDGKLILKLTVTDADGQQGNDMVIITVRNAPNIGLLSGLASPPSKEQNVLEATGGVIGYFGAVATALGQSQGSCPGCTYAWYKDNALQAASGPDYSATFAQYPYVHEVKVGVTDPSNGKSSEAKMKVISGAVTRVTTHTAAQQNPSVSGSKMVWEDNRNGYDIYAYDIATGVQLQITNLSSKQANPDIYGNRIVYEDNRNGNYEIYMYDLSTGLETRITNNPSSQYSPAIYGNRIVWEDNRNGITNYDLYMYDILTGTETQLTTDPKSQWGASIYGDKIAYTDEREGNWDIYIYDITSGTETRITQASEYPMNVDIYGTRLVWEDFRDNANFGRIYMYDLATGTESRLTSSESYDPEIYGNRVVWEDYRNGNADIYSMDVATMQEIPVTGNSSSQDHPAIYGEVIVWEDSRNSGNDIYYIPNISQPSRPRCYYDKKTQQWLPRGCNRQA